MTVGSKTVYYRGMWRLLVIACVAFAPPTARADSPASTVALLPLDADARLEIYGTPIASEIARALQAGGIDVIVVLPKMAVPATARLIVDGSLKTKGDAITLQIRVRNPADGTVIEKIDTTAASLATLDKAAADLSSRLIRIVREKLAAQPPVPPDNGTTGRVINTDRLQPVAAAKLMLVAVGVHGSITGKAHALKVSLVDGMQAWVRANRRTPTTVDVDKLHPLMVAQAIAKAKAEYAIGLEVLDYSVESTAVPLARARVRAWIGNASGVSFERVIVTDTVVGDLKLDPDKLAERVAREVLGILRPHIRKLEPKWR